MVITRSLLNKLTRIGYLIDSDFMRYICCNGRDDFTMVSVDITDSLIGISHESSEIKESEYRVRDDTSLLDLIVYTGAVKMSCV